MTLKHAPRRKTSQVNERQNVFHKKSRPVSHGMHCDNKCQSVGVEAGCFNSFAAIDHIILTYNKYICIHCFYSWHVFTGHLFSLSAD